MQFQSGYLVVTQFLGFSRNAFFVKVIQVEMDQSISSHSRQLTFAFNVFSTRFLQKVSFIELELTCRPVISFHDICSNFDDPRPDTERDASTLFRFHCRILPRGTRNIKYRPSIYFLSKSSRWKRLRENVLTAYVKISILFSFSALKPIPTMIFGFWVGGKSYAIHKYFLVLLIVSGAIMFLYKPDQTNCEESIIGYALVGISLLMNGCTAGVQEKMRAVARPSPLNLMLFLNSWSSIFIIAAVLISGEFIGFIQFCTKTPEILIHISLILFVGGCGQLLACTMITNYGVVPCCVVLTIRKFFNVLFSVLHFGNVLSIRQWSATAIIFASLLADSVLSFKFPKSDKDVSEKSNVKENVEKVKEEKNEITSV